MSKNRDCDCEGNVGCGCIVILVLIIMLLSVLDDVKKELEGIKEAVKVEVKVPKAEQE